MMKNMIAAFALIAAALSDRYTFVDSNTSPFPISPCNRFGLGITSCLLSKRSILATAHSRKYFAEIRGGAETDMKSEQSEEEPEILYLPGLLDAIVSRKNVCIFVL